MEVSEVLGEVEDIFAGARQRAEALGQRVAVLKFKRDELQQEVTRIEASQAADFTKLEQMKLAASVLQQIVDNVSSKNIARIEELVNSALSTVFYDMDIRFKITQEIKRNTNTYQIVLTQDGMEGNRDSYGGGIVAMVAFILKIISVMLCKGFPLVALDESLSFLSSKYIGNASGFIQELTQEFNLITAMVTHQPLFTEYTDRHYTISTGPNGAEFTLDGQKNVI